ncbi:MAG: ParA family partition ATPase [Pseudomonadota bacterium]
MGKIILFAQQKGGAGKTTLLTQIACALAAARKSVTLIDVDPQRTVTSWYDTRLQRVGEDGDAGMELIESSEWRVSGDARRARDKADFVLIDAPGNADILGRFAMREADFAVVPCQPSMPDVWASEATLSMLKKSACDHAVVLNRCPPRSKAADQAAEALAETGAPILAQQVGQRAAFTDAFLKGAGVSETQKSSKAAEEIEAVTKALIKAVR